MIKNKLLHYVAVLLLIGITNNSSGNDKIPRFEGTFTWTQSDALKVPIKKIGKAIWEDTRKERRRRWVSAKGYCSNLTVLGVDGWTLPSVTQFNTLHNDLVLAVKGLDASKLRHGKNLDDTHPFFSGTPGVYGNGYWTMEGKNYSLYFGSVKHDGRRPNRKLTFEESESDRSGYRAYWLPSARCVLSKTLSFGELYEKVFLYTINEKIDTSLPVKPVKNTPSIKKGEFEKTIDFEKRKTEILRKAEDDYKNRYANYMNNLAIRKEEIAEQKRRIPIAYETRKEAYKKAFLIYYGAPYISDIDYDADKESFLYTLVFNGKKYELNQAVPISYARKFKKISNSNDFSPTIMISANGKDFKVEGVKEFLNPVALVQKNELDAAFGSIGQLVLFINKYPDSEFATLAKNRKNKLVEEQEKRKKQEIERALARKQAEARKANERRQAYAMRKSVGTKVCMTGNMAFGLINPTVSGYVENVNNERIEIRIADTEGATPNYNGVTLHQGTVIWDNYQSWYKCK